MTGTSRAVVAGVVLVFFASMAVVWAFIDALIHATEEELLRGLQTVGLNYNFTEYASSLFAQNPISSFGWTLFTTLWENIPFFLFGLLIFVITVIAFNEQAEQQPF